MEETKHIKKIIKRIHTKKKLVIALLFMMVTLSFVGAATKGKKIFDDDSIHSSNLVFQPLNPAVVQISLSQPSILGKLIDHGLAIIDVGDT